jgi:hypothetical protein
MAVTFKNGFTQFGAQAVFIDGGFKVGAPNYAPYGARDTVDWGYGKDSTTNLPTPQAYTVSSNYNINTNNFSLSIGESQAFDILLGGATALQVVGVQFLKTDNTPVLEVDLTDAADFIYNGEFTILGGSTIDFNTTVDFYTK